MVEKIMSEEQILKIWKSGDITKIKGLYKKMMDKAGVKWIIIKRRKGNRMVKYFLDYYPDKFGWHEISYEDGDYIYLLEKLEEIE